MRVRERNVKGMIERRTEGELESRAKAIKGVSGLSVSTVSDGRRAESCVETEGGGGK